MTTELQMTTLTTAQKSTEQATHGLLLVSEIYKRRQRRNQRLNRSARRFH